MDERLREVVRQKIAGITADSEEIRRITESISGPTKNGSLGYGIAVGRLYNSFHYQSRRILGRDPTPAELDEFIRILVECESEIIRLLGRPRAPAESP